MFNRYKPIRCTESPGYGVGTHNYEPRYNERIVSGTNEGVNFSVTTDRTYECDICTWCGDVKKRGDHE